MISNGNGKVAKRVERGHTRSLNVLYNPFVRGPQPRVFGTAQQRDLNSQSRREKGLGLRVNRVVMVCGHRTGRGEGKTDGKREFQPWLA